MPNRVAALRARTSFDDSPAPERFAPGPASHPSRECATAR